ncbi:serine/threonine-protein kinase [Actinoplanes sp. CA-030573]|uniref:serine/threonine-protein kinase n=1 Tax=Actinoplanes sp. CA-030573 TaxID=3239898 RepID=UPI003D8D4038
MNSGRLIAGRYRLKAPLGRGGMSVVWRAEDEVLGRDVAVKVLSPHLAGNPELRDRIRAEARAAARLRHGAVVAVFDFGEFTDGGRTLSYVVMELVDGNSLADRLAGGALPWRAAVLVGAQVAAALAAAHADGIVHRDVKPANVMVTSSGVKLVDFGISAAVGDLDGTGGELLGTPAYLAPERIAGSPVRPATDVYALGLLLYLAIAGRMPWTASTVTQMVKAHVYTDPAPLPPVPGLPSHVARMVSRCLAKKPGDRPTAAEVAADLGEIVGLLPSPTLSSVSAATVPLVARVRRRRGRMLAATGTAAVVLAGGGWWLDAGAGETAQAATTPAAAGPATATPATGDLAADPERGTPATTRAVAGPARRIANLVATTAARRPAVPVVAPAAKAGSPAKPGGPSSGEKAKKAKAAPKPGKAKGKKK